MSESVGAGCGDTSTLPFFPLTNDTLRALVVFCNFPSTSGNYDPGGSLLQYWPGTLAQTIPSWADSIICPSTSNLWNRSLTGLFRDGSNSKFWLIGDVYPDLYVFQNQVSYYADTSRKIGFAVKELLENINVDYSIYDRFDPYDGDNDGNKREPDGIVDFIFINFRFTIAHTIDPEAGTGKGYSGIALLGGRDGKFGSGVSEITLDGKRICAGFPGSGCLYEMNSPWDLGIPAHEFGEHYTYGGGHSETMGSYNINGGGIASAYDREHIGWNLSSAMTSSSNTTFTLRDYITTGDYIKIQRTNYVLYIENRKRLSYYASLDFRRWKWLSTDPKYPQMPDSGLVIYRNMGNRNFDIESANGNWDWLKCEGGQYKFDFYSNSFNVFYHGSVNKYSGESTFDLRDKLVKNISCQSYPFTKSTYMGVNGDSNTCFDVDYNQVYSPWSNPPLPVSNSNDSLTIEITGRNSSGDMTVALYYTNITGASPSKPQSLAAFKQYIDQPPSKFHPKLVWNRNLEPDLQKYKIYRGSGVDPSDYYFLAETTDTTYIDESITLHKGGGGSGPCAYYFTSYAYKVSAIDLSNKESVRSLKSNMSGYTSPCEEQGAMPYANNNSKYNVENNLSNDISKFKLHDNYPNPFNPETKISFDIPESRYVTLKIYNLLGKEILVLVNEFLNKGGYSVIVNAVNLSSGIYYYKLETGNYVAVKKMIIIK